MIKKTKQDELIYGDINAGNFDQGKGTAVERKKEAKDRLNRALGFAGLLLVPTTSLLSFLGYAGEEMGVKSDGPIPVAQIVERAWDNPDEFFEASKGALNGKGFFPGAFAVSSAAIIGVSAGAKAIGRHNAKKQAAAIAQEQDAAYPTKTTPQKQPLSFLSNEAGEIVK